MVMQQSVVQGKKTVVVRIFGQKVWLHEIDNPHRDYRYEGYLDLESTDPKSWDDVPDKIEVTFAIGLRWRGKKVLYHRLDDIRDFVWRLRNPNTFRRNDMQSQIDLLRREYQEHETSDKFRIFVFRWNERRGRCEATWYDGQTHYVYVVNREREHLLTKGQPTVCKLIRVLTYNAPSAERPGFKLSLVDAVCDHINPDDEIAALTAAIALGFP